MSATEEILIGCLAAPDLKLREAVALIVLSLLKTERQKEAMVYWIRDHYKENPTEDEIIDVAEAISEQEK